MYDDDDEVSKAKRWSLADEFDRASKFERQHLQNEGPFLPKSVS